MASGKTLMQLKNLNLQLKCSMASSGAGNSAAASKMIKPPVPMHGIGGRYATALYSAASKRGKLDQVDKNMKTLMEYHEKDLKFREFLLNPLIKPQQKKQILSKELQSKLNLDETSLNLIMVMAENNRMKFLPTVAKAFNKTMASSRGEVNVLVTVSSPLDDESRKELISILENFAKGKKFLIDFKIDKTILGGLIVDFDGEHYVDMSVKRKFTHYSNLLKQPL